MGYGKEELPRDGKILEKIIEILIIIFLISFSVLLVSVFRAHLKEYEFYIHFFYLPIVISTFWWGKKGVAISAFLGVLLISTAIIYPSDAKDVFSAVIEAILFFIVSLLVSISSDEKSDALKKEMRFKQDTAHYFFNPICIAEGNLDLAMKNVPEDTKVLLENSQKAVQRIKKVVENTVNTGEIHE